VLRCSDSLRWCLLDLLFHTHVIFLCVFTCHNFYTLPPNTSPHFPISRSIPNTVVILWYALCAQFVLMQLVPYNLYSCEKLYFHTNEFIYVKLYVFLQNIHFHIYQYLSQTYNLYATSWFISFETLQVGVYQLIYFEPPSELSLHPYWK
jgi:hypothetical protein